MELADLHRLPALQETGQIVPFDLPAVVVVQDQRSDHQDHRAEAVHLQPSEAAEVLHRAAEIIKA